MDIEKLAEMAATEFSTVHTEISAVKDEISNMKDSISRLEVGQRAILEAILEIPSKKVFEKLVHKVEDIDGRVTVVESKLHTAALRS